MRWKDPKAKYYVQKKPGKLPPTAEEWLKGTEEVAVLREFLDAAETVREARRAA